MTKREQILQRVETELLGLGIPASAKVWRSREMALTKGNAPCLAFETIVDDPIETDTGNVTWNLNIRVSVFIASRDSVETEGDPSVEAIYNHFRNSKLNGLAMDVRPGRYQPQKIEAEKPMAFLNIDFLILYRE